MGGSSEAWVTKWLEQDNRPTFPGGAETKQWLDRYNRSFLTLHCGSWTYGRPTLHVADIDNDRSLTIGRYCSIAHDVEISVGRQGRHYWDTLTTYPILMAASDLALKAATAPSEDVRETRVLAKNLNVRIGHDVWIGAHAIIMAGVSIGTGAVIGARAVVTTDVPPYAIVGGVPARVIKFRHDPGIIHRMLASGWWNLDPDHLCSILGYQIGSSDVEKVLSTLDAATLTSHEQTPICDLPRLTDEELYGAFQTGRWGNTSVPVWPNEEIQRRFTGGAGPSLVTRARHFVELIERDGAFRARGWKGLDYGCGWGRISSYLLTRGRASQLDLCDAWPTAIDLLQATKAQNNVAVVPEFLELSTLKNGTYDLIYAFSVFTHLNLKCFNNNIENLLWCLCPGGKLFITVRHEEFFSLLMQSGTIPDRDILSKNGFWHQPHAGQTSYGETVISPSFLEQTFGSKCSVRYLGCSEDCQHTYRLGV